MCFHFPLKYLNFFSPPYVLNCEEVDEEEKGAEVTVLTESFWCLILSVRKFSGEELKVW